MKEREPSSTAILIARATLLAEGIPELRPLVPPGSATWSRRWLIPAKSRFGWFEWSLQHSWAQRSLFALQQCLVPGLFLHFLARKQLLERWTREAIATGCRQVVVLGAGLDTLAWRLKPEFPGVAWFELDHPDTQRLKRLNPAESDEPAPHLEALDLRKEMPDAVLKSAPAYDPALPTFYLAEGLFMYLPEKAVKEIMTRLAHLSAPGSRLAFTFMEYRKGERLAFRHGHRLIDFWLRWRREPFQWGITNIATVDGDPAAPLKALAHLTGWAFLRSASSDDLRREVVTPVGLQKEPLAEGESLALFHKA